MSERERTKEEKERKRKLKGDKMEHEGREGGRDREREGGVRERASA